MLIFAIGHESIPRHICSIMRPVVGSDCGRKHRVAGYGFLLLPIRRADHRARGPTVSFRRQGARTRRRPQLLRLRRPHPHLYARWLTPDPLADKFYPISPYSYCGGDPINNIDPDGKQVFVLPSPLLGKSNPLLLSASKPVIPRVSLKGPNPIEYHHIIPR